jgi:hypothetical protein
MANNGSDDDGAANNGFDRCSLHQWEGRLLYAAGYPAPPDFRAPGGWRLSAGGIPIPLPPQGAALDAAIDEILEGMSDEQCADPRSYPDNYPAWNAFFRRRYERKLAAYDSPPPPPVSNNAAGRRRRWWSARGRTLEAVLEHIENDNSPVLGMPPPQRPTLSRRRGSSWMPRWMTSVSSGSASARSASWSSASTLRTVKQESPSAPLRRNSGALVISEGAHTASPPHRRKPRKDGASKAASDLAEAEAARAEEAATREAIARSLRDVVPADNAIPLDAALEWSRRDWEREEAEQQRRLLDLAAAQRRAAAAAQPSRGAPVVKLEESSDDDLYRPTPPRFGDAGQGSSRQVPPPQDGGDSSDDGGDYTTFYRRLGM